MTSTLVDTNVLMDVWGSSSRSAGWSKAAVIGGHNDGGLVVNQVIWSELAPLVLNEGALQDASQELEITREPVPWGAAFLAGVAHRDYRRRGGARERTLPDFLIGAHALFKGYRLLTRDASRYRPYFPTLDIIAPDTHP